MPRGDFSQKINNMVLEYIDSTHTYVVDGVVVPSITQILARKFAGKYAHVPRATLEKAAEKGTEVHEAIERYCTTGEDVPLEELRGFKWLQKQYNFTVMENETPVILIWNHAPIAAGRLDLVIEIGGKIGGADIKRTSTLDKAYLAYQLNMYAVAYEQSYGEKWEFLKGIHLREQTRRMVDIPIANNLVWSVLHEYKEREK